jgi:glycosyltransferase involved in cell wall biosynthesis
MLETLYREDVSLSILDNASSDGTAEWLLEVVANLNIPNLRLVLSCENLGVSGGRDFLLRNSTGDILIFADSDIVVTDGEWLNRLCEPLGRPTVGISGPGGHNITIYPNGAWRWFVEKDTPEPGEVDVVSGYLQAFRRDVVSRGAYVDTCYGRYWLEDSDFCLQLAEMGYKVWCTGDVGVRHLFTNSANDDSGKQKMNYMAGKFAGKGLIKAERNAERIGK